MTARTTQPQWLSRVIIDAIHADQIRTHGGPVGIRDENALESALARPQQKWAYGNERDLSALAAAYAFGLIGNHPYLDGNKRIGFLALATFLELNDVMLHADDADVVSTIVAVAAGQMNEEQLADIVRSWTRPR